MLVRTFSMDTVVSEIKTLYCKQHQALASSRLYFLSLSFTNYQLSSLRCISPSFQFSSSSSSPLSLEQHITSHLWDPWKAVAPRRCAFSSGLVLGGWDPLQIRSPVPSLVVRSSNSHQITFRLARSVLKGRDENLLEISGWRSVSLGHSEWVSRRS